MGETALIDSSLRSATTKAKTDCRMIPLSKKKLIASVQETPDFAMHVMAVLAVRIAHMNALGKS